MAIPNGTRKSAEHEAPHRTTRGAGAGQVGALVELHLAVPRLGDPGNILQLDQELFCIRASAAAASAAVPCSGYAMTARVLMTANSFHLTIGNADRDGPDEVVRWIHLDSDGS